MGCNTSKITKKCVKCQNNFESYPEDVNTVLVKNAIRDMSDTCNNCTEYHDENIINIDSFE